MRSDLRHLLLLVFSLGVGATCPNTTAYADVCSAYAFEKDAVATFASCTTLLKSDLATVDKAQAFKIRGRAAHRLDRLEEAISDFDAALKLTPNDPELYIRRGWTYYDQLDNEAAYKFAAHALTLNANEDGAYDLAGAVMMRFGDFVRAKAMFDDAVRLRPHNILARFHRYQLFDATRKLPEALAELDGILDLPIVVTRGSSLKLHPLYGDQRATFRITAGLHRAFVLYALGRDDEVKGVHDQLVIEDPSALTFALRATYNRQAGTVSESEILADVDKAIAHDPSHWLAREVRALVHFNAKRYEAAAAEFTTAIKLGPDLGRLLWGRSMALRKLDRIEEATTDALAAIDLDPNYFVTYKLKELQRHGYFQPVSDDNLMPALRDAVRACMLDERCR